MAYKDDLEKLMCRLHRDPLVVFGTKTIYRREGEYFFVARTYGGDGPMSYGPYDSHDQAAVAEVECDAML